MHARRAAVFAVLALFFLPVQATDWIQSGYNGSLSHSPPDDGPTQPRLIWVTRVAPAFPADLQPLYQNGTLLIPSWNYLPGASNYTLLNASTGAFLSNYTEIADQAAGWAAPVWVNDTVYFNNGSVVAFNLSSRRVAWKYSGVGTNSRLSFSVTDGVPSLYLISNDLGYRTLVRLSASNGTLLARSNATTAQVGAWPVIGGGSVVLPFTSPNYNLLFFRASNLTAYRQSGGIYPTYPPSYDLRGIFYAPVASGYLGRRIFAYNLLGTLLWNTNISSGESPGMIALDESARRFYFVNVDTNKSLYAYDGVSGNFLWRRWLGWGGSSRIALSKNGLVYICADKLYAVDAATGAIRWNAVQTPGCAGNPLVANGTLFVMRTNGQVAAYSDSTVPVPQPPVISGDNSRIGNTSVEVFWNTAPAADAKVEYGVFPTYGANTSLNTTLALRHSQFLYGLQARTDYVFRVWSCVQSACAHSGLHRITTQGATQLPPPSPTPSVTITPTPRPTVPPTNSSNASCMFDWECLSHNCNFGKGVCEPTATPKVTPTEQPTPEPTPTPALQIPTFAPVTPTPSGHPVITEEPDSGVVPRPPKRPKTDFEMLLGWPGENPRSVFFLLVLVVTGLYFAYEKYKPKPTQAISPDDEFPEQPVELAVPSDLSAQLKALREKLKK